MKFKMTASDEQVEAFNRSCELSEYLFAISLAKRITGLSAVEAEPFILEWFRSVRQMTVANHIDSGIKIERVPD